MSTNDPTTHPTAETTTDATTDATLADEVFVDEGADHGAARTAAPTSAAAATASVAPVAPVVPADGPWLRGPAPFAIVLGLIGLLVAGATLLNELTDVEVPWADLGPWTVVAAGLVVVLVGAIGLRSSRRAQA